MIGFHGGLGGNQSYPYPLHPSTFTPPELPIVGAATLRHIFENWMTEMERPT